jgi:hypothetical protein
MGKQINNCNDIGDNMINAKIKNEVVKITSLAELNELSAYINAAKTALGLKTISVGSAVYVVQKTKKTLGTVLKVKIKKALVELPQGKYNVPLSMLEAA